MPFVYARFVSSICLSKCKPKEADIEITTSIKLSLEQDWIRKVLELCLGLGFRKQCR